MPNVLVDITIVPIGTANTSISDFVAASEQILKEFTDIRFRINPMSTTLEGELERVCELVRRMHEAPFNQGASRVSTHIRIDDRRDGDNGMTHKIEAIREKAGLPA